MPEQKAMKKKSVSGKKSAKEKVVGKVEHIYDRINVTHECAKKSLAYTVGLNPTYPKQSQRDRTELQVQNGDRLCGAGGKG
jgi:hypothetical protein